MAATHPGRSIPPQVVVVIGPPGAGKGTQCRRGAGPGVVHLSTGEALRAAVRAGTPIGRRVEVDLARGALVDDDIVLAVVAEAVERLGPGDVILLDGFPRTVRQTDALVDRLESPPALALEITVPVGTLRARVASRVVCSRCGQTGNAGATRGALHVVCSCGGLMEHRRDDGDDELAARLELYQREHRQIVARLRAAGTPHRVLDGSRPPDDVATAFAEALAVHTGRAGGAGQARDTRLTRLNVTTSSSSTTSW